LEPWTYPLGSKNENFERQLRSLCIEIGNKKNNIHLEIQNRQKSECQNSSDIMSNDICEYYEIIKDFPPDHLKEQLTRLYNTSRCDCLPS